MAQASAGLECAGGCDRSMVSQPPARASCTAGESGCCAAEPRWLARFRDDLVEHWRAWELLPAGLGDHAAELVCAVRGPEVCLRLPVRHVHPPIRRVG